MTGALPYQQAVAEWRELCEKITKMRRPERLAVHQYGHRRYAVYLYHHDASTRAA